MRSRHSFIKNQKRYHKAVAKKQLEIELELDSIGEKPKYDQREILESQEEQEELRILLEEEDYYQCEQSLYHYLKCAWNYLATGEFQDGWYIEAVCEHVQACLLGELPSNKLIINIPPRHLKSSICSVAGPTWLWGPRNQPEEQIASFSCDVSLSTRDALKSRRLIQSEWYQSAWGSNFQLMGDQNAKSRYENNHMGVRYSSSVSSKVIGKGYDILLIDDPIDAKRALGGSTSKGESYNLEAELRNVIDWYTIAMPSRANNPKTAREIIIMQRVHQKDLVGHIESTDIDDWTVLKIPMEYDGHLWNTPLYWWQDKRKELGEILDPKRFGDKQVRAIKHRMPDFHYSAQYQQEPVPPEGLIIKERWFRYWQLEKDYEMIWQSWDLAMDDGPDNDFTVGTVWGKIGCDRFLLDMFRGQWDINEQAKHIVFANMKYPATRANLIENKANGHAVAKLLKDPVQIQKIHHYAVPGITLIDPKKMGGDKKARLTLCATEFSAGSVYFPPEDRMPWVSDVRKELCGFPRYKNDDIADSCSQALNYISQFGGGLAEFDYPRSMKELYEQKQREKEFQTATVFDGMVTQRGLGQIFM